MMYIAVRLLLHLHVPRSKRIEYFKSEKNIEFTRDNTDILTSVLN